MNELDWVTKGTDGFEDELKRLEKAYSFVTTGTIGNSATGKPISFARIGTGPFRWHFNGACHANEWITTPLLTRFVVEYAEAISGKKTFWGKSSEDLLARNSLFVVPMLNPDGVALARHGLTDDHPFSEGLYQWNRGSNRFHRWKANARGVDLNDQFPAYWEEEASRRGVTSPCARDYGGLGPLSEPEAAALVAFTERNDFHAVIALHTQGEEIYWNYRGAEPPESRVWAERMALAAGYRAVYLEGSDAGYKDWFIHRFGRPGFTVEAGWGRNPLPTDGFEELYDDIARLLAEALDCSPAATGRR
ncbi:M14 family metallocarboxypeptidase [Cohnella suwonensis]|uniref:M14 family metallocarboxypeptidase n=1 Tax=Cohnella suwonensis TaxID=696072 RepID=A0ABW0M194_9BACL